MLAGMRYLLTAERFEPEPDCLEPRCRRGVSAFLERRAPMFEDAEGLFHAPSAVTTSANARWTPHSGRGAWFVPRWRQTLFSRRYSTVEQTQHETSAHQECPDCHALAADLEAHKQWHSRLVHDIAIAVDRDVKRRVGAQ